MLWLRLDFDYDFYEYFNSFTWGLKENISIQVTHNYSTKDKKSNFSHVS